MLLSNIKRCLQRQSGQTLLELSRQFQIDSHVLREMLSVLVRKGQIRQCTKTPQCGTACHQCVAIETEVYEWVIK